MGVVVVLIALSEGSPSPSLAIQFALKYKEIEISSVKWLGEGGKDWGGEKASVAYIYISPYILRAS